MTESALFDIQSVLRILFREASLIERETLERIIAFDMEWLDPFQSEQMVEALLTTGWISIDGGWCKLKVQLSEEELPLGWFPRPQHLLHPVAPHGVAQQRKVEFQQHHESPIANVQIEDNSDMGGLRRRQTKRLKSYLSRASGLSVQEIERRAERKVHALQYTTQWMALALIAKEVGLPMNDIIDVFQS